MPNKIPINSIEKGILISNTHFLGLRFSRKKKNKPHCSFLDFKSCFFLFCETEVSSQSPVWLPAILCLLAYPNLLAFLPCNWQKWQKKPCLIGWEQALLLRWQHCHPASHQPQKCSYRTPITDTSLLQLSRVTPFPILPSNYSLPKAVQLSARHRIYGCLAKSRRHAAQTAIGMRHLSSNSLVAQFGLRWFDGAAHQYSSVNF